MLYSASYTNRKGSYMNRSLSAVADVEKAQREHDSRREKEFTAFIEQRAKDDINGILMFFGFIMLVVLAGLLSPLIG